MGTLANVRPSAPRESCAQETSVSIASMGVGVAFTTCRLLLRVFVIDIGIYSLSRLVSLCWSNSSTSAGVITATKAHRVEHHRDLSIRQCTGAPA